MIDTLSTRLAAVALSLCALLGPAYAADPLPAKTQLVAAGTAAPPTQLSFTIATSEDLAVTLTDLQIPAPVVSAGVVVTQAGAIVAKAQLSAPATSATVALPAASGNYTMYVFGVPSATYNVGTFSACVAPKASPSNCIQSASLSGNLTVQSTPSNPATSTLSITLNVTTQGAYTFNFSDLLFPVALSTPPTVSLFQGSTPIQLGITSGSSVTLNPGQYNLLAIAQADATVQQGLYSIDIVDPTGTQPLLNTTIPVGTLAPASTFNNPASQSVTLTVTDYGFPAPLASASAMLTSGSTVLGTASAAVGAASFTAPSGTLTLWTAGSAATTPGTYSVDISGGGADLFTAAQGVNPVPAGASYAYAFVTPTPLTAGAYQAAAADLQFPSQLSGLSFAVAQAGLILKQSTVAGTLSFTAAAGNAVLLVSAQTPASGSSTGNGLFDVNLQSLGTPAQLVFDKTQSVSSASALFDTQSLTIGVDSSFDVNLTDLMFPVAFDNLALVVSRGNQVLGKIFGGGQFSFAGSPGTYQLSFVATPSANQSFGLYSTSVVYSPPAITLTSSVATAPINTAITLSWSAANATSCTASGGAWTGSKATTSSTESVVLAATTTYVLTCTGPGGSTSKSVAVTATAASGSSHGGGALDGVFLTLCGLLLGLKVRRGQ